MKQSDFTFKEKVSYGEMLEMASKYVSNLYEDPDERLTMAIGAEYLWLQAAMRLFTNYGATDGQDDLEGFMEMVFSVGVERFKNWLMDGAGVEKYRAFERMTERGVQLYLDMGPLETLVDEAGRALRHLNRLIEEGGELTTERAVELLQQFVAEQEKETPPEE